MSNSPPLLFADLPASIPLWVPDVFVSLIKIFVLVNVILGLVSYTVMAERRISAAIQDRIGPNRVGIPLGGVNILGLFTMPKWTWWGLGQPLADALKFMLKEEFTPAHVNKLYFWMAPAMAMVPALLTICVIPFSSTHDITLPFFNYTMKSPGVIADVGIGVLLVFAIASLSVYGIVLAGWSSNSKYPFLGGIRSSAQMISYEVSMGLSVIPIFLVMGNLRLSDVVQYQVDHGWTVLPFLATWHNQTFASYVLWIPMLVSFIIFLVSAFAETNRLPFDLPESETELVGGYHTEYSAMKFALFFLGEYAAMIVASCLMVTLFLGGWSLPWDTYMSLQTSAWSLLVYPVVFLIKMCAFIVFFIWIRWTLPRFRYDQLMGLGWKCILPISLGNIVLTCILLVLVG
ncbi:MAG TPA: complex I subunit 1 family protein [Candidatus Methylacidiphilales bacterium]|nr:complex I subunit 1 family protein [Candidatus Methylacidiphilales bacterium]